MIIVPFCESPSPKEVMLILVWQGLEVGLNPCRTSESFGAEEIYDTDSLCGF